VRDDTPASTVTAELLDQYLAGDRESERLLFERHRAELIDRARSARWMRGLHRYTTPEDLVGEVFVRALSSGLLRHFESRGSGSLGGALAKVLGDVAVDAYRRHGATKRGAGLRAFSLEEHGTEARMTGDRRLPGEATTPTSSARQHELLELCRAVLPAREWEVWWMCEVEGRDSPSVAATLGVSDSAVRGTLHRARKRILREMSRRLADD